MPTTYLVLPAWSEQAGQLRIVSRRAGCTLTLTDYRNDATGWADAGLVAAQAGRLVCLNAPASVWAEFKACEPIRAPLVVCVPDEVAL